MNILSEQSGVNDAILAASKYLGNDGGVLPRSLVTYIARHVSNTPTTARETYKKLAELGDRGLLDLGEARLPNMEGDVIIGVRLTDEGRGYTIVGDYPTLGMPKRRQI